MAHPRRSPDEQFPLEPEELLAIFSATSDVIAFLDRDGRFLRIAPTESPSLMRPREQLLGRTIEEVAPREQAVYWMTQIRKALEENRAMPVEYSVRIGERESWSRGRVVPVGGDTVLWTARDITDQRRAAEDLVRQREFLRRVIDLVPNFIFAKDREGRFTLVNQAVAEAYGTTAEGLIGKTDADFNPNLEEVDHFRRDDLEVMDTGREKLIPEEVITDAAGRVRWLQTIKRALPSSDGVANLVLGVATDITERKKLEEQLVQSRKLEAIGLLAGGIAHDFNNLLTAILGAVELLQETLGGGDPRRVRVDEIHDAASRAADLTRQLLAFSRKQVMRPRVLALNQVVEGSTRMLRRLIGEDIELITRLDPALGNVKADLTHLHQVLVNLAVNARDAMPRGGRLEIETANLDIDGDGARLRIGVEPGPYVRLAVSDTGVGMDAEIKEHIFEPFFTTKERGRGTGLGLSTVHGIVNQSGGHILVHTEPGKGSVFEIVLPRVEEPAEPIEEPMDSRTPVSATETVLVVEDEDVVRDLTVRALKKAGYAVIEASGGDEALEASARHAGPIHLLLADVVMPGMSGPVLAHRLSPTRPEMRVLYMSGYAVDSVEQQGLSLREIPLIQKPFSLDDLSRKVRDALRVER
jgi:PAS domain S-box-containing protein